MKKTMFRCAVAAGVAMMMMPASAHAAGFYLQEQSVSAMGAAYAGSAALGRDPSAIYYNPAALTQVPGTQLHIGANYLHAKADYTNRGSTLGGAPLAGIDSDDPIDGTIIPNLYVSHQINDVVWVGLGVSVPFGMEVEYAPGWYGRYDSIKTDLKTFDFQPTVAWRVNDWLSVGGGVNIQMVDAELTSAAFNGAQEGISKLEGDDISFGWNIGVTLQPTDTTILGLHYRSGVDHNLDGRIIATGMPGGGGAPNLNINAPGTAELNLPSMITVGLAQDLTDRLTLLGQVTHFEWSSFNTIKAILSNGAGTVASDVPQRYKNSMNYSIGLEYDWSDAMTFRVGYQHDNTPVRDEFRTTRTPDADRNWFTGGVSYHMSENITLDFSAAYIKLDDAKINVLRNNGAARVHMDRDDSWIGIAAAGLTYRF